MCKSIKSSHLEVTDLDRSASAKLGIYIDNTGPIIGFNLNYFKFLL